MIQYRILNTGLFHADGGAMFGAIPKRAWSRKCTSDEQNRCLMAMNCLLVWTADRVILLDTGVGTKHLGELSYYDFQNVQDIRQMVWENGFNPEEVTDVILSHLHFDHCGGCTFLNESNELQLSFPNARHYVGGRQWKSYLDPNELEIDSFRLQDMLPIQEAGLLELVDEPFDLIPGFHTEIFDGHTLGQLASWFDSSGKTIVFPGDIIPTKAHLSKDWISAYDIEPLQSITSKQILKDKVKDLNPHFVFYHS